MRSMALGIAVALAGCSVAGDITSVAELEKQGFKSLFDGKTLAGWKANENESAWSVTPDGLLKGSGERSHLFSDKEYVDFEFRAEAKTEPKANSGMYFRAKFMEGWPDGYEAQVNNSHADPVRTGSLYHRVKVLDKLCKDGEWFEQHVICKGNKIVIKVNGKITAEFTDDKNSFTKGRFAFQQHDPGSVVYFRNIMVKDLSAP